MRIADCQVCFSHGQESGPWGSKITAMADVVRDRGAAVESLDYRGLPDPTERVRKLVAWGDAIEAPLILVGSSMGGHVAAAASSEIEVAALFLLAPAFYMPGYEALTPTARAGRITIVHGWNDEIVPAANSVRWAQEHGAELHLLNSDHRLTDKIAEINRLFDGFLQDVAAG